MTRERTRGLRAQDRGAIWHPFTQLQAWATEEFPVIERGQGCWLEDTDGRRFLDGISSLWCNVHGHRVEAIDRAVIDQLGRIAHSTLLGLSSVPSIELAERLTQIAPAGLTRVFYSDAGATAVEAAVKMAFQYQQQIGQSARVRFAALGAAYHGDTIGSVSLGGIEVMHGLFDPLRFDVVRLPSPHCYRCPLGLERSSCAMECVDRAEAVIEEHGGSLAGLVIEPLVQGAAGMIIHPEGYLRRVAAACRRHGVLLVADEVATGFGRTGTLFACEQEEVTPDLLCLAKGLSGGYLPLAATLATEEVCAAFSGTIDSGRAFYHGHTYTGNALGCAAALASLDLLLEQVLPQLAGKVEQLRSLLAQQILPLEHVGEVRHKGLMVGIELVQEPGSRASYAAAHRMGHQVTLQARRRGVIVRPLGDVVVLMPPLAMGIDELELLVRTTAAAIQAATEPGESPERSSGASERECRLLRAPKAPEPSANGSRSTPRKLLVAGTDTGVGKTVVSVLLTTALRLRGLRTTAMKPVESGVEAGRPQDAMALASAAAAEPELNLALCPYRLSLPVAPESAAVAEGAEIQVPVIRAALDRIQRGAEIVVVESAGGIGTPLAPDLLVLDLARELGLPVLLVARDALGTVGQTLVALRAMAREEVPCLGVILCRTDARPPGPEGPTHAPLIESHGNIPVLGNVPFISEPMPRSGPELRSWAARQVSRFEGCVDLDRLLSRL